MYLPKCTSQSPTAPTVVHDVKHHITDWSQSISLYARPSCALVYIPASQQHIRWGLDLHLFALDQFGDSLQDSRAATVSCLCFPCCWCYGCLKTNSVSCFDPLAAPPRFNVAGERSAGKHVPSFRERSGAGAMALSHPKRTCL